jgi:zinc protease
VNPHQHRRTSRFSAFGLGLLATLVACLGAPAAHATNIERVISPGGIEFWMVRDSAVPLVALNFSFRGGTVQDPDDKAGLADLTVSTLDEGAGDLDATAFQARLERKAIELQFRASREHVRGTVRALTANMDEAFELLRLALSEPRFDQSAIERMRAQHISTLQRQSTDPNAIGSKKWWATAFPDHPYGRPTGGTLETIARITADDMKDYARRVLTRDGLKIGIVGDIDGATAGRLIDRAFGPLPAKADLRPIPDAQMQGLGTLAVISLDVPQAVVTFGTPGVVRSDPEFMAAYLMNHILAGGTFTSRLYNEVREKRGLAYGVSAGLHWLDGAAILVGGTATRADATADTIDVIEREFRKMAAEGPTEDELAKAKAFLTASFALNLDTSSKIATQLVQQQIDNLGIDYIDRRAALINAVTIADVRSAAKRLLGRGMLVTVVGRPQGLAPRARGGPGG